MFSWPTSVWRNLQFVHVPSELSVESVATISSPVAFEYSAATYLTLNVESSDTGTARFHSSPATAGRRLSVVVPSPVKVKVPPLAIVRELVDPVPK